MIIKIILCLLSMSFNPVKNYRHIYLNQDNPFFSHLIKGYDQKFPKNKNININYKKGGLLDDFYFEID
jgi:hypothetical protein